MMVHTESLRERKKARTRADIIWAATQLFEERGYDATSMDQVARLAEISRGTLFNYFASKDALLNAICEQEIEEMKQALERDHCEISSPIKRLERLVGTESKTMLKYKNVARLIFHSMLSRPGQMPSAVFSFVETLRMQVLEAQSVGEIDPDVDATELMVGFMGVYAAWLFWASLEEESAEDHQERFWSLLSLLLKGIEGPAFRDED